MAVLALALAQPATAGQQDPRPVKDRPHKASRAKLPERPAKAVSRTGELTVGPPIVNIGDTVTATFSPKSGAVNWAIRGAGDNCQGGYKKPSAEQAKHLPVTNIGGATSCSFKVGASTNRTWASIGASITGPCGDPEAVRQGRAEYAICAGSGASDTYLVLGPNDNVIEGYVTGTEGDAVPGMRVEIKGDKVNEFVVTDASGYYSVDVDPGSYLVRPSYFQNEKFGGLGGDDFDPHDKNVSVNGGKVEADFKVKGHRLSGHVSDRKGKGLGGLTIGVRSDTGYREATTGSDGAYKMTVPRGNYSVEVKTPPPAVGTNRIWGAPYTCKQSGAGSGDYFCKVDMSQDRTSVNFEFNPDLSVEIKVADKPDGGRFKATILVTDSRRQPVGNQEIHIIPTTKVSPRVLVCDGGGGRKAPAQPPSLTETNTASSFNMTTDDQGKIELYLWPGSQSGEWSMDAEVPKTTIGSESAHTTLNLPDKGGSLPNGPQLEAQILARLKGATHVKDRLSSSLPVERIGSIQEFYEKTFSPAAALDSVSSLLQTSQPGTVSLSGQGSAQVQAGAASVSASLHPVHSADSTHTGIVFLPPSPDDQTLNQVGRSLQSGGSLPANASVLDTTDLVAQMSKPISRKTDATADPWSQVHVTLVKLSDWPGGGGKAALGRPDAGGEEQQFTYFGWPEPPSAPGPLDRCAGITSRHIDAGKASPVRMVFTNSAGKQVGDPASGSDPVVQIAGASVGAGAGDRVGYRLPADKYKLTVTGTGSGKARVMIANGDQNQTLHIYDLNVRPGESGTLDISSDGPDPTFTFGGTAIKQRVGLGMTVTGLPKSVPLGTFHKHQVKIVDELGDAVPNANIEVTGPGYQVDQLTDSNGSAEVNLLGVPGQKELVVKVSAYRHGVVTLPKISIGRAAPETIDPKVTSFIGPEKVLYLPADPSFPWVNAVLVVVLLTLAGLAFLMFRGHPERRQAVLAAARNRMSSRAVPAAAAPPVAVLTPDPAPPVISPDPVVAPLAKTVAPAKTAAKPAVRKRKPKT